MHEARVFLRAAFGLTWGLGLAGLLTGGIAASNPLWYILVYAASLAGILLTLKYDGMPGLRSLAARLNPLHARPRCFALILLGYPFLALIAALPLHPCQPSRRDPGPRPGQLLRHSHGRSL